MSLQPHTSVFVWNGYSQSETYAWCTQVIGQGSRAAKMDPSSTWHCVCRDLGTSSATKMCYVFTFINPAHKLLFDIAFGHLGIHDSVAALEAAIKTYGEY